MRMLEHLSRHSHGFIHPSVREKWSRIWTGTFYRSKKVSFLELSLTQIFSGNFPHSVFLKDIFRKIPAFQREECSPWLILEKLTLKNIKQKTLAILKCWL